MHCFLWYTTSKNALASVPIDPVLWIADDGGVPTRHRCPLGVAVAQIQPVRRFVAVALVPELQAGRVARNGVPLSPGLHPLIHADRLDLGTQSFWIGTVTSVERTQYTPSRHGQDVFCFITKARLSEGEPIVVCPGTSEQACGTIYRQEAWERAMESTHFKCPNCSFTPQADAWQPPEIKAADTLADLAQLISG